MKKIWYGVFSGCALLLTATCSFMGPVADGSGTETTTGFTAAAVYPDGMKAAGALVRIRPADFFQSLDSSVTCAPCLDTITDKSGRFHFTTIDSGEYVIEINDHEGFAVAVRCEMAPADTLRDLGTWTVKPWARLSGKLDAAVAATGNKYIAVRGLKRLVLAGMDGVFSINNMPEGSFELRVFSGSPADPYNILENVKTVSGSTFAVQVPSEWDHSRVVYLNTTAGGANVRGDVTAFPVLFRLNPANFDFSQADDAGSDIRFAKQDGSLLPAEIERYSKTERVAEIWVKTDTVYGNDSNQAIVMSWGNPAALVPSNGSAVFNASNGFLGVWHLSDNEADSSRDATSQGHSGVNYGATDAMGMIGGCKAFDGNDSVMIGGLLGAPRTVTLSAWARSTAADTGSYEIISIGGYIFMRMDLNQSNSACGLYHIFNANSPLATWWMIGTPFSVKSEWHYLTYTLDSDTKALSITVDGDAATRGKMTDTLYYSGLRDNTCIGAYAIGNYQYNFLGAIDEVRVSTVVRSADWNKLCYMNQKEVDALVTMK